MAKETKSISVAPSAEQTTIALWENFGWELVSSQEIFNQESHLERSGDDINSVTTTTNYVKLVFSRDKNMRNYAQIVSLESEYECTPLPKRKSAKALFILGFIVALVGAYFMTNGGQFLIGVLAAVFGVGMLVLGFIKKSKNSATYNEEYGVAISKRREILQKASSLLLNEGDDIEK